MLELGRLKHLSAILEMEEGQLLALLDELTENPAPFVHELRIWPADQSRDKFRDVIAIKGKWRRIQKRLYRRLLLPRLSISPVCHGSVRKRSQLTNARCHVGNSFAFATDIRGFFPSISCARVNRFFLSQHCSRIVASALTRLCTYDFHLAMGLTTSPHIANSMLWSIDNRISHACVKMQLVYTRFVDDITISGKFDLARSGVEAVIQDIIERHGFRLATDKTRTGRFSEGFAVTGIRIKEHSIDTTAEYAEEIERLIDDHLSLSNGEEFVGPLLMEDELRGKVRFACIVNRGRSRGLYSKFKTIKWDDLIENAISRDIAQYQERTCARDLPRPDPKQEIYLAETRRTAQSIRALTFDDMDEAPF